MQHTPTPTNGPATMPRKAFNAIVAKARDAARSQQNEAALELLTPLIEEIAAHIAHCTSAPISGAEDWEPMAPRLIDAWFEAARQPDKAEAAMAGRTALSRMLAGSMEWSDSDDVILNPYALYLGTQAGDVIRCISNEVMPGGQLTWLLMDAVASEVRILWIDELCQSGPPKNLFVEMMFFPGLDPETDLCDSAWEMRLRKDRPWYAIESLIPGPSLANLLNWFNVSVPVLIEGLRAMGRTDDANHVRKHWRGMGVRTQSHRPSLEVRRLVDVIENGGYTASVPVVYGEVCVADLLRIDPTKPFVLDYQNRPNGSYGGMHDMVNGAGYVDLLAFKPLIDVRRGVLCSATRMRYGVGDTHDFVRSRLRCTPRNFEPVASRSSKRLAMAD